MTKNENETPDDLGRIIKNTLSRVSEDTKKKRFSGRKWIGLSPRRESEGGGGGGGGGFFARYSGPKLSRTCYSIHPNHRIAAAWIIKLRHKRRLLGRPEHIPAVPAA